MNILLLSLFIVSYFLHLPARLPFLGEVRFEFFLGMIILLFIIMTSVEDKWRLSVPGAVRLNQFFLYVFLSLPLVTWPGSVIRLNLIGWSKVALLFVFIVCIVRTEKQLKFIILVFLCCQAFRIFEPLYLHVTTGYWGDIAYSHIGGFKGLNRLSGSPYDVVNSTQFAWVIVSAIPFLFYLLWPCGMLGKLLFAVLLIPSINALLLTGARSGLLSLMIVIFAIILLSKKKQRNLLITLVALLPLALMMFNHLTPEMQTRYFSLVDSTVAGADTKQGRITGLIWQLGTISQNPLFGNGLGTTREVNWNVSGGGSSQITHNLYIEILQCNGIIGFTIFMLYITTIFTSLRQAHQVLRSKGYGDGDWLWRLVSATLVWIVMDIFYSFSCFGLISWEWYFFGGVSTVCVALVRERVDNPNMSLESRFQTEAKYS